MKRRKFIKNAVALSVASVLPYRQAEANNSIGINSDVSENFIIEKERRIPVRHQADVVVCGGGPAGIGAAIEAARSGAKVILVEHAGFLGGTWTAGLLGVMLDHQNKKGLVEELKQKLIDGHWKNTEHDTAHLFTFDTEGMKLILDELCAQSKITVLLYTYVTGAIVQNKRITHIITESKSGREAIAAKMFVDCTGDGDVAFFCGCSYDWGDAEGNTQPMSMLGAVTGLDFELIKDCVQWGGFSTRQAKRNLIQEIRNGGFEPTYRMPCLFELNRGIYALMAQHQFQMKSVSRDDLTRASIEGRNEVHHIVQALQRIGGRWKDIRLVATASQIGCREGRRIHGLYTVTQNDLTEGKRHKDAICHVTFGVDIHSTKNEHEHTGEKYSRGIKSKPYDIPLRALIPKDIEGLLLAGRCISGDFTAHSSYRVNGNSVIIGQNAGYVAAQCALNNIPPIDTNIRLLNI
ncbi:MAG TPA: FAD-dependent oxidoreductase [Prevotellaceae bacterium]|jgi:hypothetical protein|nr:FAD-dependent oxidoreductase [Prevotellaceae bacterium]